MNTSDLLEVVGELCTETLARRNLEVLDYPSPVGHSAKYDKTLRCENLKHWNSSKQQLHEKKIIYDLTGFVQQILLSECHIGRGMNSW